MLCNYYFLIPFQVQSNLENGDGGFYAYAYEICRRALFKTVKVGKYVRVSKPSFDSWLDSVN